MYCLERVKHVSSCSYFSFFRKKTKKGKNENLGKISGRSHLLAAWPCETNMFTRAQSASFLKSALQNHHVAQTDLGRPAQRPGARHTPCPQFGAAAAQQRARLPRTPASRRAVARTLRKRKTDKVQDESCIIHRKSKPTSAGMRNTPARATHRVPNLGQQQHPARTPAQPPRSPRSRWHPGRKIASTLRQ